MPALLPSPPVFPTLKDLVRHDANQWVIFSGNAWNDIEDQQFRQLLLLDHILKTQAWQNDSILTLAQIVSQNGQDLTTLKQSVTEMRQFLDAATETIITAASGFTNTMERVLQMLDDVRAGQDRTEAATTALQDAVTTELQQLRDAVNALSSAPTAAEISDLKTRVNANADRIESAVAQLTSDDPTP